MTYKEKDGVDEDGVAFTIYKCFGDRKRCIRRFKAKKVIEGAEEALKYMSGEKDHTAECKAMN